MNLEIDHEKYSELIQNSRLSVDRGKVNLVTPLGQLKGALRAR